MKSWLRETAILGARYALVILAGAPIAAALFTIYWWYPIGIYGIYLVIWFPIAYKIWNRTSRWQKEEI